MSSHILNVAAVDLDIAWADRKENLYTVSRIVHGLRGQADIVVLPELFSTGFVSDPGQLAELADNETSHPSLDTMMALAAEINAAICGSVLHARRGTDGCFSYRNRCYFVEPSGEITFYDKRHLFCLSSERRVLGAGESRPPVVRFRGCNVTMAICYDLRFPCWLRNRAENPYDLLLIPSNWPQAREFAWRTLLAARAIENQCYVVGANRAGSDDMGTYDGQTVICSPAGKSIGVDSRHSGAVMASLDLDALARLRADFPVLRDMD